jgi:hypothetical protein
MEAMSLETSSRSRDEEWKEHNINHQAPVVVRLAASSDAQPPEDSEMADVSNIDGKKEMSKN